MVRIENHSLILEITCLVAQTWIVLYETSHTTLFGIYYCVQEVRIENHRHMLEIT